ncbi:MAG TPA: dienelactone hydrolase family protein [Thermoanaerobaculia bacterium]|nr:dienelactone hydrolase family protein [Thermoanaerobaculia bacterium]
MRTRRRPTAAALAAAALPLAALLGLLLAAGCARGGGDEEQAAGTETYDERVAAEHEGDRPIPGASTEETEDVEVTTREVTYATVGGREATGYLAFPAGAELRPDDHLPGLVLIHEWWGLNDNVETMARMFARHGYQALAVDLYGGEVADDPERARALTQSVDQAAALDNLRQAVDYLSDDLGAPRVGVLGWCFGGGWSLQAALAMPDDLDAAVVYYGRLVTEPAELEPLAAPLLGIFGGEDSSIPVDQVRRFESALDEMGKDAEVHVYEGAGHAFANPSGDAYQPEASRDAWEKTLAFLEQHLKEPGGGTGEEAEPEPVGGAAEV